MKILLTNDDGVHSDGFKILSDLCVGLGYDKIQIMAPKRDKSGVSQSITLNTNLNFEKLGKNVFCLDGTPVDCVIVAMSGLIEAFDIPDIVISGINIGMNAGVDTLYSGTVGAAVQSNLSGVGSFAISQFYKNKSDFFFNTQNEIFIKLFANLMKYVASIKDKYVINVNLPCIPIRGVKLVGCTDYIRNGNIVEKCNDDSFIIKMGKRINVPQLLEEGNIMINLVSCNREIHYQPSVFSELKEIVANI
ncbi:5'/3'-nucleotidase SurE [Anaplasmataceae bacterium AB001_6]|nr:5'/3'-nucleotidase SurE [Anaplasmataceae bacterium AB001_6]